MDIGLQSVITILGRIDFGMLSEQSGLGIGRPALTSHFSISTEILSPSRSFTAWK